MNLCTLRNCCKFYRRLAPFAVAAVLCSLVSFSQAAAETRPGSRGGGPDAAAGRQVVMAATSGIVDEITVPSLVCGLALGLLLLAAVLNLSLFLHTRDTDKLWLGFAALLGATAYAIATGFAGLVADTEEGGFDGKLSIGLASGALLSALGYSARRLAQTIRETNLRPAVLAAAFLIAMGAIFGLALPEPAARSVMHGLAALTATLFVYLSAVSRIRGAGWIGLAWIALPIGLLLNQAHRQGLMAPLAFPHALAAAGALGLLLLNLASLNETIAANCARATPAVASEPAPAADRPRTVCAGRLRGLDVASRLAELRRIMESERLYCDEDLNLARLAAALDMRPDQLSLLLNQELRVGFADFVNGYRVAAARQMLLDEPERSLPSIAAAVGFNTRSAFYGAFRKFTGGAPGSLRPAPALPNRRHRPQDRRPIRTQQA